ncbi:MAG: hypothetical protein PVJ85_12990 [Anaerolineae bacterium]|jgi:uncharacterized repeat protein (TIGR01451 family)
MKEQTFKTTRRLAATGFLLILLLALLVAWGATTGSAASADDLASSPESRVALYEIWVADYGAVQLELVVPDGFEYVGLAADSQVGAEAAVSTDGRRLTWQGPFDGAQVLRFWLAAPEPASAPETLTLAGELGQAVQVAPAAAAVDLGQQALPETAQLQALAVTKTVEPEEVEMEPGDLDPVTYEVVFTTDGVGPITLDRVTDTLPSGFTFVAMAPGSEILDDQAPSAGCSPCVWTSLTDPDPGDPLTLRYYALPVSTPGTYSNSVEAVSGDQEVGPASAALTVEGPEFTGFRVFLPAGVKNYTPPAPFWEITKTSNVTEIEAGDLVDYTLTVANSGTATGSIGSIADTLPTGFTFQQMLPGGNVLFPPDGVTGEITWELPWDLAPGETLVLIYRVASGGSGEKVNTAVVRSPGGAELARTSTSVYIGGGLPFYDDFSQGASSAWKPFVNWSGLSAANWYWAGEQGSWGIYVYQWDRVTPWTGYALSWYDGPGAQTWTNYRVEAVIRDAKDTGSLKSGLTGVFFRGTVEDSGLLDGKSVRGYYVYLKPTDNSVYLLRTNGDNPSFAYQDTIKVVDMYEKYNILIGRKHWYKLLIEVRGSNIQVWFDDEEDPNDTPIRLFNVNDGLYDNGTVGFATYYTTAYYDYIRVTALP